MNNRLHPLVTQLYFARSEFLRGIEGLTEEDAVKRLKPMNSISWMLGHLANQENFYWVRAAQGLKLAPELRMLVGTGRPASTPPLDEMRNTWEEVTKSADIYLAALNPEILSSYFELKGTRFDESVGTLLQRVLYHYWFHLGEAMAVRQMLGHENLPEFVGGMESAAYYPE